MTNVPTCSKADGLPHSVRAPAIKIINVDPPCLDKSLESPEDVVMKQHERHLDGIEATPRDKNTSNVQSNEQRECGFICYRIESA